MAPYTWREEFGRNKRTNSFAARFEYFHLRVSIDYYKDTLIFVWDGRETIYKIYANGFPSLGRSLQMLIQPKLVVCRFTFIVM
jgi:hypothetical protein